MFDNLQDKLEGAFKILKGQGSITEINVAETMRAIRKIDNRNDTVLKNFLR